MVGHDWSVDIFNDGCSAAINSVVDSDPVIDFPFFIFFLYFSFFYRSFQLGYVNKFENTLERVSYAYAAYENVLEKVHENLPPNADPIEFQNFVDPTVIITDTIDQVSSKYEK